MAVYTTVSADDLAAWLTRYALGAVHEFEPIVAGIENTNYFLTADNGRFVLTLYERTAGGRAALLSQLDGAPRARRRSRRPPPRPTAAARCGVFSTASLRGSSRDSTARRSSTRKSCTAPPPVTRWRGCISLSAIIASRLSNRRGPAWWRQAARAVRPFLSLEQNELLASEIKFQAGLAKTRLPRGAIHGDLFCDNVLFDHGRVSGIIDFGFAATDALAYDLAIAVNDWCSVSEGASAGALDLRTQRRHGRGVRRGAAALGRGAGAVAGACCAPRHCGFGCRASTIFICRAWGS